MWQHISIQSDDFDAGLEQQHLQAAAGVGCGALVTFTGCVRGGEVAGLFLEHYPGMTEQALTHIVKQAAGRWALLGVRIIHREGELLPGANIVFVGVAAAHRGDAFAACDFIMDFLKTAAPFWKKETLVDGSTHWVEAKATDTESATRWT